jgi:hypothetical protein
MTSTGGHASEDGFSFQLRVAALFLASGAEVNVEVSLGGQEIDLLLTETQDGELIRTAVQVKRSSRPLSVNSVRTSAAIADYLVQRGLIDRLLLVSEAGFTQAAKDEATQLGVGLLTYEALASRAIGREEEVRRFAAQIARVTAEEPEAGTAHAAKPPLMFVVMPFAREFDDVYILGIRDVAEKLGFVVQRGDDIEHNSGILETILKTIEHCSVVIADTTNQNPNVFYEIGHAHALSKPTVLISRAGETIPFDLRGINHISYQSIVDLRERLERRLRAMDLR